MENVMVASERTQHVGVSGHDRYLIYRMLGREISFRKASRKRCGIVEHVCRNIFDKVVEVTIDGTVHRFDEPMAIVSDGEDVLFVYGDISIHNAGDDTLFANLRDGAYRGDSLEDVLAKTARREPKTTRFLLGPRQKRTRLWRRKTS
jgi:hypothetical protein